MGFEIKGVARLKEARQEVTDKIPPETLNHYQKILKRYGRAIAPVSGSIVAVNDALDDAPETVNQDPYGDGWFFKIEPDDATELDELLDSEAYAELCENEEH